jgi:hypothetical protein
LNPACAQCSIYFEDRVAQITGSRSIASGLLDVPKLIPERTEGEEPSAARKTLSKLIEAT